MMFSMMLRQKARAARIRRGHKLLRPATVRRDNSRVDQPRAIPLDCWRPEETMTDISALFWDNGGVILTNGWDRNSRRAAVEKFHLDWSDFEDRHELMLNAFETGRATLDEYLRRTIFYRERAFTPEDFKQFMFDQSQPFTPSLGFLATLVQPRSYLMASLNNESLEINEYRVHKFNLRQYFQAFFCSCYLGVRKPEEQIYKLALKISQREPQECVFIDDRGLNLECARELGMHAIQFQNVDQLRKDLAQLGINPAVK
jgi:putative hydrolase of the HAD superfamily